MDAEELTDKSRFYVFSHMNSKGGPLQDTKSSLTDHVLFVENKRTVISATFKVLTAVNVEITACWAVTPSTLLG
jgi:hypothetical protein